VDEIQKSSHSNEATGQYLPMSLIIIVVSYKVVLSFGSVDKILSVTFQVKSTEQYLPMVPLRLCSLKVILPFESVDKILKV